MLEIKVGKVPPAQFSTIGEALLAVPYGTPAVLQIAAGVYEEKIFCEKKHITLRGEGPGRTILRWHDAGYKPHPDGRPTHTFRSYSAFFGGEFVAVRDMTIENDAGEGADVGQGIAAYVDAACALFENVELLGSQDTLFCAPLPQAAREPDGFLGPRVDTPRRPSRQFYHKCRIVGDVDFIFGGADAFFSGCEVFQRASKGGKSFATAPSGGADGLGFVFHKCQIVGDAPQASCWLGRPWRPYGKTAVLACTLGAQLHPEGWAVWSGDGDTQTARFAEWDNTGPGAGPRPGWVTMLDDGQAAALLAQAENLRQAVEACAGTCGKASGLGGAKSV